MVRFCKVLTRNNVNLKYKNCYANYKHSALEIGFHAIVDEFHATKTHRNCPGSFKYDHWETELVAAGVMKWNKNHIPSKVLNLEKILRRCQLSTAISTVRGWISVHNLFPSR